MIVRRGHASARIPGSVAGALFAATGLLLSACQTSSEGQQPVVSTVQAQTSQELAILLPAGVHIGDAALVGLYSLQIADRVRVEDADGELALVVSSGMGDSSLGVESKVGRIVTGGNLQLRNDSWVEQTVTASGSVAQQQGAVVDQEIQEHAPIGPLQAETITVDFGSGPALDQTVGPDATATLPPGRYGRVQLMSRSVLRLTGGTYSINALVIEPESEIVLEDEREPVRLDVRDEFIFRGKLTSVTGGHPAMRVVVTGQNAIPIEAPFRGTIIAPNATLRLATVSEPHEGTFYAKSVEVAPDNVVILRPYWQYEATPEWTVDVTAMEPIGAGAFAENGDVVVTTLDDVLRIDGPGQVHRMLSPRTSERFTVDQRTGRWGYATPEAFFGYYSSGQSIAAFPLNAAATVRFAATSDSVLAMLATPKAHDPNVDFLRVLHPSGAVTDIAGPVDKVEWGEMTPSQIVYTTRNHLVTTTHSGVELWRRELALRDFTVSHDGARLIGVLRAPGSHVVHVNLSDGTVSDPLPLASALWDLAAAPGGAYTAATIRERAYVFRNGNLSRQVPTPAYWPATVDVNDAGELILGGHRAPDHTHVVFLSGPLGTGSWQQDFGADGSAFKPFVRFDRTGRRFLAITRDAVTSFSIGRVL